MTFLILLSGCKKSLIAEKDLDFIALIPNAFMDTEAQIIRASSESQNNYSFMTDLFEYTLSQPVITEYKTHKDFTIDLHYSDQTFRTFYLDIDINGQKAYLSEGDKTYSIVDKKYQELIGSELFISFLSTTHHVPELKLSSNDLPVAYVGTGTFEFKSFSGTANTIDYKTENTSTDTIMLSSDVLITYTLSTTASTMIENIYQGDVLLESIPLTDHQIILPIVEGDYTIELISSWPSSTTDGLFKGKATYHFLISIDLPVAFSVTQSTALPGDCFVITAQNVNEGQVLKVTTPFYEEEVIFLPYNDYYVGILPIYAWVEPQEYVLTTSTTEPISGLAVSSEHSVEVAYKYFDIQYLTVTADTLAIRSQENINSDAQYLQEARSTLRPEKLWEGTFVQPVEGVITTEYSDTRYTNDNPVPSRHSGIDIAAKRGTPVKASNTGYVTMAMPLYISGNTVILDHGMGIFTAYSHLDEISVQKGDLIPKGDIVGTIGTTGFSTGPHLHFTFYINGTYVNPWTFFEKDILGF